MGHRKARILILCKTYPSPSTAHTETSCIAGIEENGNPIRLYPVPFRLIEGSAQFKKWQWITAKVEKARKDHRPESNIIGVDTHQVRGARRQYPQRLGGTAQMGGDAAHLPKPR